MTTGTAQASQVEEKGTQSPAGFRQKTGKWLVALGPGLITAALVFGPSKMTITSKLGSEYGYSLLWAIVAAIFFMAVFTAMASRIALATQQSLLATIRQKWGNTVAIAAGIGIFLVTASFQAGNSIGVGVSMAEATHTSTTLWVVLFNIIGIALLFFRSFYKVLEKLMIFLVVLMLFAFVTTFFLVKPAPADMVTGFVPSVPEGSLGLVIALFASSFSIVGALYQAYLVQERRRISPSLKQKSLDSLPGIVILGVMAAIVLICAAAVLYPAGIKVKNAADMALTLQPLFGSWAGQLFLIGLFGASFSSLIGNASVGGTLLGDALGYGSQLQSKAVKGLIALVMVIGATIAIIFGKLPLQLIVLAQSVTILVVPFIGIAMYLIAMDGRIMGKHRSSPVVNIVGFLGLLILLVLAGINVKELFFK